MNIGIAEVIAFVGLNVAIVIAGFTILTFYFSGSNKGLKNDLNSLTLENERIHVLIDAVHCCLESESIKERTIEALLERLLVYTNLPSDMHDRIRIVLAEQNSEKSRLLAELRLHSAEPQNVLKAAQELAESTGDIKSLRALRLAIDISPMSLKASLKRYSKRLEGRLSAENGA